MLDNKCLIKIWIWISIWIKISGRLPKPYSSAKHVFIHCLEWLDTYSFICEKLDEFITIFRTVCDPTDKVCCVKNIK